MAELLGNPLKKESVVTPNNVNAALKPGYYTMVLEPITVGGVSGNYYGVMNVYESDTYIVQVGYATTGIIMRHYRKNGSTWANWMKI